jgi:Protein involved in initiation of plasmid replication
MSAETHRVVKHNDLVKARSNLSKIEHRVIAMLIAQLDREDESFDLQRIYIRDIIAKSGSSSQDLYSRGKEICQRLLNQQIHIQTKEEDGQRMYEGYNALDKIRYAEGDGYIEARFNDSMKPFLLELKRRFTIYQLEAFMQLGSRYSMRIYELLKMREDLRWLRMPVERLRKLLSCENKYSRFGDFRRRVVERAQSEVNETTDISFTYKVEREGQSPERINFMIKPQSTEPQSTEPKSETQPASEAQPADEARPEVEPVRPDPDESPHEVGVSAREAGDGDIQFNLYAMVLSGLSQRRLSELSEEEIWEAIRIGRKRAGASSSGRSSAVLASEAVRIASSELKENE